MQKQPSIGILKKSYHGFYFFKKAKNQKLKKWAESLKNTKIYFTKNKLFHKHFSGIFA